MAHFLRGRQAGVQGDLSAGIEDYMFALDDFARYGVNSQISSFAYDPVQSLLAVGTNESHFGPGKVYVFGQKRVCFTFHPPRSASIRDLRFCVDKLVIFDSKNDVSIFSLETKKLLANYTPPGRASCILTDPSIDYCITGLQNGEVVAYDLDRESTTPFRIPNLWREHNTRARLVSVVSVEFHPKDIGTLLIGYSEGAVLYSFKQAKALKYFEYQSPRGSRLTHAVWHPTGTFILTAHDDASLAFWDPHSGRLLHTRTLQDALAASLDPKSPLSPTLTTVMSPFTQVFWCSKENPDDTGILLAGGYPSTQPIPGLTFLELGPTPMYQTSSWDILSRHFQNPKSTRILPVPPGTEVSNVILIPRSSPYFSGSHDPIAILVSLSSGELITMSFPSGHPITPTNQLHLSLTFVHPFITKLSLACIDRTRWLGMREVRQHGPNFLDGGAPDYKPSKPYEARNVIQAAHADGTIRIWDAGHGDSIENEIVLQADLPRAVGRAENVQVTKMSMSGATGELSVGLFSGEVVVFRLGRNANAGRPSPPSSGNEGPGKMTDISKRADPALKEGLLPLTLTNDQQGPITALRHSDVGFVAVGYDSGGITLIDLRGPAIIHTTLIHDMVEKHKTGSIRRRSSVSKQTEWPTAFEFGVLTLEGDDYSSIALFVGTSKGNVATFKILPSQSGRYSAQFVGVRQVSSDPVISLCPVENVTGELAAATGIAVAGLQQGRKVEGVLVVTTVSSAHIFRPAHAKAASKTFDNALCHTATVSRCPNKGSALVGVFSDGSAKAFSLPALKVIGSIKIDHIIESKRFAECIITPTGDVMGWTGPSEVAFLNIWGSGLSIAQSNDRLFDPAKVNPPRPVISSLQWIAGVQYITPLDLDVLIGGPDRPPSKRMMAEMRAANEAEFQRQREAAKTGKSAPANRSQETYWDYMSRQIQERTEQLGLASDSMDRAADSTETYSESVSTFIAKQKRQAALGFIGSKFGF